MTREEKKKLVLDSLKIGENLVLVDDFDEELIDLKEQKIEKEGK